MSGSLRATVFFGIGALTMWLASAAIIALALRAVLPLTSTQAIPLGLTYPYWIACIGYGGIANSINGPPHPPHLCFPGWSEYRPALGR